MMRRAHDLVILTFLNLFVVSGCTTMNGGSVTDSRPAPYLLNPVGSAQYVSDYWKPHSFGFRKAEWKITFADRVTMDLNNQAAEFGHIACGSWWVPNFLHQQKLPLQNVKALTVSVDVCVSSISYAPATARLRMAVASAIALSGASHFTELDFWDSPELCTLLYPNGNKYFNGSDEYSYKLDQVPTGQWTTLTYDFLPYIKASWGEVSRASLECVYIVIESDCRKRQGEDQVSLEVRNLLIHVSE